MKKCRKCQKDFSESDHASHEANCGAPALDLAAQVRDLAGLVERKIGPALKDSKEAKDGLDAVRVKLEEMNTWLHEVDRKAEAARYHVGSGGRSDQLRALIPERHKHCIEMCARKGEKDPVAKAALEVWFKNAIKIQIPKYSAGMIPQLLEENDKIQRAFGDGGVEKAAFAEGAGATGGFTVPTPLEAEVLRVMEDAAICRPLCRKMTMTAFKHLIPDDAGGVSVAVVAEAGAITQSEPSFGQKTLEAKMIAARGLAALQVLQDSSIGLIQYWLERASEAYGLFEDDQILEGDGTNFTGLSNAVGVNEVTNGTNGAAPTYAKLVEQVYKAKKRDTRSRCSWVMSPAVLQKIIALADSAGAPILNRQDLARVLNPEIVGPGMGEGTILGFPVFTSDQINDARTVGSSTDCSIAYFGPFAKGVILGDLLGLSFDVSEHVAFNNAQLAMRLLKRTAILVGTPAYMTKQTGLRTA